MKKLKNIGLLIDLSDLDILLLEYIQKLDEVFDFEQLTLIHFVALEEVSKEMAGKVKVVKVDVDANPEITTKYQIQAMPTLIMLKDGEVVGRHTGALVQKSKLSAWINSTVDV